MVCDKVVCERWCVTKWCVKDGGSKAKMVCDEVPHCQPSATSATPATQMEGQCHQVPHLPRKWKVNVTKCHVCHANGRSMSPSATPATQMEGQCHQVPRLPRKWKINVTKRHACYANGRSMSPSATSATQMKGRCHSAPRLPRETKVDVTKCHTCHAQYRRVIGDQARHQRHAKRRQISPSATPATRSQGACHQAPLPREVRRRHRRPSAPTRAPNRAPKRATRASPVPQLPRLPRKWKADVTECHRRVTGDQARPRARPYTTLHYTTLHYTE